MKKKTRYVLLGLLQEEQLTGYEIKKIIDIRMKFFWQESYGQIYPELNLLLKEGFIKEVENKDDKVRGKDKIRYSITPKGQLELKQWMKAENEKETVRSEFLLKMFMSTDENQVEMEHHLKKFHDESIEHLELFKLFEAQLTESIDIHKNHRQILDVLALGIKQQELYLSWSEDLIKKLGNSDKSVI